MAGRHVPSGNAPAPARPRDALSRRGDQLPSPARARECLPWRRRAEGHSWSISRSEPTRRQPTDHLRLARPAIGHPILRSLCERAPSRNFPQTHPPDRATLASGLPDQNPAANRAPSWPEFSRYRVVALRQLGYLGICFIHSITNRNVSRARWKSSASLPLLVFFFESECQFGRICII